MGTRRLCVLRVTYRSNRLGRLHCLTNRSSLLRLGSSYRHDGLRRGLAHRRNQSHARSIQFPCNDVLACTAFLLQGGIRTCTRVGTPFFEQGGIHSHGCKRLFWYNNLDYASLS